MVMKQENEQNLMKEFLRVILTLPAADLIARTCLK